MQNKKLIAKGKPNGYFHNMERGDLYLKTPSIRVEEPGKSLSYSESIELWKEAWSSFADFLMMNTDNKD